jgi:hypothetical protein
MQSIRGRATIGREDRKCLRHEGEEENVKRLLVIATGFLVLSALIAGCGRGAPTDSSVAATAQHAFAHGPRPMDAARLAEARSYVANAMETWYMAGQTDFSYFDAQLARIEDAEESLSALEAERRKTMEVSDAFSSTGQADPFALNHELDRIGMARKDVLAEIGVVAQ